MNEILIMGLVAMAVVVAMAGLLGQLVGLDELPVASERDISPRH